MSTKQNVTAEAIQFIESVSYEKLPAEALRIGKRCMVDTLGLYLAGGLEHSVKMLAKDAVETGGREDAYVIAAGKKKVPAALAARVLATAGHAHDWDDTQVSHDPAHVYGLLTHPSCPPLTSALVMSQKLGNVDGKTFMTAFQTGFEVECKISEWMKPVHYRRGHHSSGTVGTFGAAATAAKLLGLKRPDIIGLSVMFSGQVIAGLAITLIAQQVWPGVAVVWGGAHVTALADRIANDAMYGKWVDGFVAGYAERTWVDLLDAVAIKGAAWPKEVSPPTPVSSTRPSVV